MKVILPLAGKGTRLQPLTNHVPKPMLKVAGRPVLDYVLDNLEGLPVEELLVITGHLKEQVVDYFQERYPGKARFVEQEVQDGTGGAVARVLPYIDGPVMIIYVDTLFDADLTLVNRVDADGIIWVKEVEDYQRYGVIVTDDAGNMIELVEKPSEPVSQLANIGLYYFRDWEGLCDGIRHTMSQPSHDGEWYLTDAFQHMADSGRKIKTAEVAGWYDCGKVGTLLETNLHLLSNGRGLKTDATDEVTLIEPVRIEQGASVSHSVIGPNVTIESGARVDGSTLRNVIVGNNASISASTLEDSLVGEGAVVEGKQYHRMVVAHDEVGAAP